MELNELHIAERSAEKPAELNSGSVKAIFGMLYDILALYEASGCYNYIPGTKDTDGAWGYFEGLIENARKKLTVDFLGKRDDTVCQRLDRIISETEVFIKRYEVPGVVTRWQEINPQIKYFDCVFDLMDEMGMETAEQLNRDGRLAFFPSDRVTKARNAYFAQKKLANDRDNLQYSEERIFQNELLRTLAMVFENDFGKDHLPEDV